MPFRIRLGGLTRYPRYVGSVNPVVQSKTERAPVNHTHGVKSHHAEEFKDEFAAQEKLTALLSDKSKLTPEDQRALETATIEEV